MNQTANNFIGAFFLAIIVALVVINGDKSAQVVKSIGGGFTDITKAFLGR